MDELLNHPAIQAGVLPFLAALLVAFALARTRLMGLVQIAGLLVVVAMAIGFDLVPVTAMRKLVILCLVSGLAVLALELTPSRLHAQTLAAVCAGLAVGTLWMLWRLLVQQETGSAVLRGLASIAFATLLAAATVQRAGMHPVQASAASLVLGLGTGALAILGSSLLLAQLSIAAGASAGAVLLVQLLRGQPSSLGRSMGLPAAVVVGLAALLAAWQGTLPWYCLLPLLAIPLLPGSLPPGKGRLFRQAVIGGAKALVPMLVAIGLALASGRQFPQI